MSDDNNFIWRFTPSRTDPKLLERIFVQRESLLDDVTKRVEESATTGNKHHMLLIGPRGIGKTHFVSLLNHRVTNNNPLARKLRVAWLGEDETSTSFVQLLARIYRALSAEYPQEFPEESLQKMLESPPPRIQELLRDLLIQKFASKTMLLITENLDLLFDGLGEVGQKELRSFLQENPFACIVATSQKLFNAVQKRTEPFYGFFTPIHLKPLVVDDAIGMLRRIADQRGQTDLLQYLQTPEGRSRIRALRHLAGGNHRIFIILSGFITRDSLEELVQPFEKMADQLTPYYQERMRWLSPQQRQIVEFLCSRLSPMTPKQIARNLLAAENTISSQLKKLSELGYVSSQRRGRESLYELTEPLMRLAGEVKQRGPLRLLVDFLRVWYRPVRLSEMLLPAHCDSLKSHLSAAIDSCRSSIDPRLAVIQEDIERARAEGRLLDAMNAVEEKAHTTNLASDWFEYAHYLFNEKKYEEAMKCLDKALVVDPNYANAWNNKGVSLCRLQRNDEAIRCYEKALRLDPLSAHAAFNMCEPLLAIEKWNDGLDALRDACAKFSGDYAGDTTSIIHLVHNVSEGVEQLRQHLAELVDIYHDGNRLISLGDGLVRGLANIDSEFVSEKTLELWRDIWSEFGKRYEELEIPSRIYGVGTAYLINKDERALLDLIKPERAILKQALGLDMDGDDQ